MIGIINPVNETDTATFRTLVRARLDELDAQDQLGQGSQSVVRLDQQSVGRLSRMDALQVQAMAKAQQVRRDAEKRQLRAALDRLDEDEYGYCEDCGEPIPPARLRLSLTATRCVSCASG